MPKPKTSPIKKDSTERTPAAGRVRVRTAGTDATSTALLRLAAGVSTLTDADRSALRSRFSEAYCDRLGASTRAEGVRDNALAFASTLERNLAQYPAAAAKYSPIRFAWFLECLSELHGCVRAQSVAGDGPRAVNAELALATAEAKRAGTDLEVALEQIVGHDELDTTLLGDAKGDGSSDEKYGARLTRLANLGADWLRRTDSTARVLVRAANLTDAMVERARAASTRLHDAHEASRVEPPHIVRDLPSTNRVEGRMLAEMRVAMNAMNAAKEIDARVQKLAPTSATSHVLAQHPRKSIAKPAEPTKQPTA